MIEPTTIQLTIELLEKIAIDKIIYAEYAHPGAMGNAGGIMIYVITDGSNNCYETNINTDKNTYIKAVDILKSNQITSRNNDKRNENGIFNFYGGGFGNNALVNKDASLKVFHDRFIYTKNDKEYIIYSSVHGVFACIASEIRRKELSKRHSSLKRNFNDFIDDEKKQDELLQEKLDREIITGKKYTEKEINAILKECCTSQDHVSFRRELIDKGYLCRTNDCKEYWRNENK